MKRLSLLLLCASLAAAAARASSPLVHEEMWQGLSISLHSANSGSINPVHFSARIDGDAILDTVVSVEGIVTAVEVADLDRDGFPEIYAFVASVGSGSYGSIVAFASNRNRSMTPVHQLPLAEGSSALQGYMGHDRFRVLPRSIERSFPVYRPGDTNAGPSGGRRRLEYELVAGETGWLLQPRY